MPTNKLTPSFYTLLSLPATAMGFALSVQITALSWILSTQYNLDIHEIGYVWLAGPLAGIIGQLSVGAISDKVWFWGGRRKPFIIIGGILAALMLLLLPNLDKVAQFLGIKNLMIVALIVALVLDLAINVSFNPTRSLIADVTQKGSQRTKGYLWMQFISGFFGVCAYFLGATLGNYALIYIGVGIVLAFSLLPLLFIKEPKELSTDTITQPKTQTTQSAQPTKNISSIFSTQMLKLYTAHAFTWLGVQTMFVYIFAYLQQSYPHLTDVDVGKVIAYAFLILNTVGFILPVIVLEPLSKKIGRIHTHTLAIALMALGYLGILLMPPSVSTLYILMAIVGIGWAATVSIPFAILADKVQNNKMGLYMGIFNLSVVLPQIIVSSIFGNIIKQAPNKNIVFFICTICLAISAILWLFVKDTPNETT